MIIDKYNVYRKNQELLYKHCVDFSNLYNYFLEYPIDEAEVYWCNEKLNIYKIYDC